MGEDSSWFQDNILPWFHRPGTYKTEAEKRFKEGDDIWSHFELFQGGKETIQNKVEWYQSPNVPTIYKEHKYVFRNIDLGRPYEEYYFQHQASGAFEARMGKSMGLPSGRGKLWLKPTIATKAPPSGENDFAFVEYNVNLALEYDMPGGITFLPRIMAYPMNKFFKWAFLKFMAEEMIEYDGEFAREKLYEYFQYIRKYHGEEPLQSKTRESSFKPAVDEGVFFQ